MVKLSLSLIEHHSRRAYGGVEVWLHTVLALILIGGEWLALCPSCFIPRVKSLLPIPQEAGWAPGVDFYDYQVKRKSLRICIYVALIFILVQINCSLIHGVQEVTIPIYMFGYIIIMNITYRHFKCCLVISPMCC